MNNLKRMPVKVRKELERAGKKISSGSPFLLCYYMGHGFYDTQENKMCAGNSIYESRGARLIRIAIMLTMPLEIINHKCTP